MENGKKMERCGWKLYRRNQNEESRKSVGGRLGRVVGGGTREGLASPVHNDSAYNDISLVVQREFFRTTATGSCFRHAGRVCLITIAKHGPEVAAMLL
jgi:hypothetical protein